MKRILTPLVLLAFAGSLTLAGCAKKEETSGTTTDSTLSLGDLPPETSPATGDAYTPGAAEPEPAPAPSKPRTTTKPKPRPSTPSTPAPAPGTIVPTGTALSLTMDSEVSTKDKVVGDACVLVRVRYRLEEMPSRDQRVGSRGSLGGAVGVRRRLVRLP